MAEIKQPKIRFKGHINDWEQRKLGNLLKTESSKQYITEANIGDYPVIQQGDKSILGYSDKTPFSNFNNVVLFGDHTLSLFKPITPFLVATDGVKILSSDNLEGNFLYAFLQKYKPESQGYKRHFTILKNETGNFPINTEEQQKIGTFFKSLDDTIALHQQKLEVTKQFKQTMLKKMFPKNGETTPEIRFKGFTEDWEDEKFLDICSVKKGTQLNKDTLSKEKTETYKYPVYNGSVNPIGYTTESNKEKGLIMTEGGDVGRVLFSETPFWSSGHSYNITSVDNNIYYLQYLFESNYRKINSKGLGVTIKNLSLSSLKQIILTVNSSYQEQELIGNYFKELDNQINALDKKLETYKEFKKAMLQKMFI